MLSSLQQFFFGTLRRQLFFGMTLTVTLVMTLFVWQITNRNETVELRQHSVQTRALAQSIATSSAVWVASRDFSGLQDIVESVSNFPNLLHVVVLDLGGQVLAHSDPSKIGLFITVLPKKPEIKGWYETESVIDVVSPIMLADKHIGWVRIGLDRTVFLKDLARIKQNGFFFSLVAIVLSVILTSLASRYLTRRLNAIQQVADKVQAGDSDLRVSMTGNDEAAKLAWQFNSMLDSLAQRDEQLLSFYSLGLVGLAITSPEKGWIRINDSLCKMLEYTEKELRCMTWEQVTHLDDLAVDMENFTRLLANEIDGYSIEKRFISRTGKEIPTRIVVRCARKASGEADYIMAMVEDITQSKEDAIKIEQLAYYDPLTNLANRRLLIDRLKHALAFSARSGQRGALLFLDLDHFKTLNDTRGHDIGDLLLQQVAARLGECTREGDTIARFGGDEFVILLEGLSKDINETGIRTESIVGNILKSLSLPYDLEQYKHNSTASIGATLINAHESTADELLKQADIAMYQAKQNGRNRLCFFDPQMQANITARAELESELRRAIANQQFQLYYQIQVNYEQQLLGAEALIRWIHPDRGLISPLQFIPLAEESDIILVLGQWVLDTACAQLNTWQKKERTADLTISVNVSAKQFHQIGFVSSVKNAIEHHNINPQRLKLELTESLLLDNINSTIKKMKEIASWGVRFSLDDFGTGYSSLQYLKLLPLYQLKIDQSFVRDIVTDDNDKKIVRTIIAMAQSLDMSIIAEGVETEQQQALLFKNGCTNYQGYLFSRPLPIKEFELLLNKDFLTV